MTGEVIAAVQPVKASVEAPLRGSPPGRTERPPGEAAAAEKEKKPAPGAKAEVSPEEALSPLEAKLKQPEEMGLPGPTRLDIVVENDGIVMVKVRDAKTDKVVREVPPEELIEFGRRMKKYLGVLFDKRA